MLPNWRCALRDRLPTTNTVMSAIAMTIVVLDEPHVSFKRGFSYEFPRPWLFVLIVATLIVVIGALRPYFRFLFVPKQTAEHDEAGSKDDRR